jgi:O-antigen/teichoic acid export membrane protein
MTFAASAFQLAYGPFAYARARDADAPRLFARVFTAFVALASLGALVLSAFAPEALAVLVPVSYRGAALPALGLAFAAVGLGAYTVASVGIGLALRTPLLSLCAWSGAVAAGVAHALWTPRYGPPGAAFATMIGYVVIALVTYAVAQRVRPMPYRGGRALGLYALAFGLALAAHAAAPLGAAGVAARAGIILLYVGVCAAVWYRDRNPGTRSARTVGAENAN